VIKKVIIVVHLLLIFATTVFTIYFHQRIGDTSSYEVYEKHYKEIHQEKGWSEERINTFIDSGNSRIVYQNQIDAKSGVTRFAVVVNSVLILSLLLIIFYLAG